MSHAIASKVADTYERILGRRPEIVTSGGGHLVGWIGKTLATVGPAGHVEHVADLEDLAEIAETFRRRAA